MPPEPRSSSTSYPGIGCPKSPARPGIAPSPLLLLPPAESRLRAGLAHLEVDLLGRHAERRERRGVRRDRVLRDPRRRPLRPLLAQRREELQELRPLLVAQPLHDHHRLLHLVARDRGEVALQDLVQRRVLFGRRHLFPPLRPLVVPHGAPPPPRLPSRREAGGGVSA